MVLKCKILFTGIIVLNAIVASAQQNSFEKANLKGSVKKVTTIFYAEDLENGTGFNRNAEKEVWYDVNGKDSLMFFRSEQEDFKSRKTSYLYDELGKLDSVVEFDINKDTTTVYSYEYNTLNQLVKQHEIAYKDKSYVDTYYEYNDDDLMVIELVNMDNSDDLFYSFSYKYENGNVIEMISSLSPKSSTFKYNEHNDRVFYENTVGVILYEYEYDEFKNWKTITEWVLNKGLKDSHPSEVRVIEYY
jgi:hypothetical protein